MNAPTDGNWYQVLRSDASVGWIEGNPASAGDKYLDPGMCRSGACRPDEACFGIGQIARDNTSAQAKTAGRFCEQDREINGTSPIPGRVSRSATGCLLRHGSDKKSA